MLQLRYLSFVGSAGYVRGIGAAWENRTPLLTVRGWRPTDRRMLHVNFFDQIGEAHFRFSINTLAAKRKWLLGQASNLQCLSARD